MVRLVVLAAVLACWTAAARAAVVDVFFVGGQSNATSNFYDGVRSGLIASGQFPNMQVVWKQHGGTPIASWYNNGRKVYYLEDLYDPGASNGAVESVCSNVVASGNTYRIRGFFWFQGEADTHYVSETEAYGAKFTGLLEQLATDLNNGDPVPFGMTLIAYNPDKPPIPPTTPLDQTEPVAAMRVVQRNLALDSPVGSYADSSGYERMDTWHLPATVATNFGIALAEAFVAAQPGPRYWDAGPAGSLQSGNGIWGGTNEQWSTSTAGSSLTIWRPTQNALFYGNGASVVTVTGMQSAGTYTLVGGSTLGGTINTTVTFNGGTLNTPQLAVRGATSSGVTVLNLNGTAISGASDLRIQVGGATAGTGTTAGVNQNSGALAFANLTMGGYGSVSSYTINGGTLTLTGAIMMGSSGVCAVAFNGGLFTTTGISGSSTGTQTVSFGGGTLKAAAGSAAFINTALDAVTINAGGGTIDSNSFGITIPKVLSGTGPLTKTGTGTLTLAADNAYSGITTIRSGTLRLPAGGGMDIGDNNFFAAYADGDTATLSAEGGFLTTSGYFGIGWGATGACTGTVNQTAGAVAGGSVILGRIMTPAGNGYGFYNLSGGSFSGNALRIGNTARGIGVLTVSGSGSLTAGTCLIGEYGDGTLTLNGGAAALGGATLALYSGSTGVLNLNGGTLTVPALRKGAGASAILNWNGGTLKAGADSPAFLTGLSGVNLTGGGAVIDDGGFAITVGQALTGSGGLTKTGDGTLTLTGANTYTGATTISNGTLRVNGSLDSTAVTVAPAGTLSGDGTIQGAVAIHGTLAPGNSVGLLTVNNSLALSSAATFAYDIGVASDSVAVAGNLTLAGTMNIANAGGFTTNTYTLFTYGGTLTNNGLIIGAPPNPAFVCALDTNTSGKVNLKVTLTPFAAWQVKYFGSYTNTKAAASADPDGDRLNNEQEFLAGTLPLDSDSVLRMESLMTDANGGFSVRWPSATGRTYQVQYGGSLFNDWLTNLPKSLLTSGPSQTNLIYTDSSANTATTRYYRIQLIAP